MRSVVIGFVIGAALLQNQATLPSIGFIGLLLVLAGLLLLGLRLVRHLAGKVFLLMMAGALTGFAWAGLFASYYLAAELPKEWEGRDVTVIGTVASLPTYFEQGARFNFEVEQVFAAGDQQPVVPPKLALSWYLGFRPDEMQSFKKVNPGERWQLTVRLKRPHGNANPYGFDYEAWLLEQNIRATGYVRADQNAQHKNYRLDDLVINLGNLVQRTRGMLRDRIYAALSDKPYAGVIVALVIGDQKAISQSDWEVFNRTGVGHLISIFGLHVTMVAGLFATLIFGLWRRSFFLPLQLPLILPAHKAAALAGACIAFIYVLLAGFGVPAQRTLYMLTAVAVALWLGRITSVSHILCLALGIVVLLDPWAVLWPRFWLSFFAVAIILYGSVGRIESWTQDESVGNKTHAIALKTAVRTQYMVTLGLIPLTMLLFGQISVVGPIANAVAIPLISFLVTPLALIGSALPSSLSVWLLTLAHGLIEALAFMLEWLNALPFAVWSTPIPSWWMFTLGLVGMVWLLAPRGWPARWLGIAGLLPLFLNAAAFPERGQMWVAAFDVGQGTAVLVETPRHRLLYDTGPVYSAEADSGNRVIVPYLKARGINALDAMVISHSDMDHFGGAMSVLEEVSVQLVSSSMSEESMIIERAANHRRCEAGQTWVWDDIQFEMLHPTASSYEYLLEADARSCTLKISLGDQSILLPGDIEAPQERTLLNNGWEKLQASILLAPHRGSGTSSTRAFLEAARPEFALFQIGYRNRYQHPKSEVFERYGELGVKRLRSDESGAVMLRFDPNINITEYRVEHARHWYGR